MDRSYHHLDQRNDRVEGRDKTAALCPEAAPSGTSCSRANRRQPKDERSQDHIVQETVERTGTVSLEKQSLKDMMSIFKNLKGC